MSTQASPSSHLGSSPRQSYPEERQSYIHPPRKTASTGGGRAWSEEEENFLIETRQHKMPYKHIAAQLNKTELACRLHYHQLSFGTKRRRRTSSVSSNRSASSTHSAETMAMSQQRPLPQLSPPASPPENRHVRTTSPGGNPVPILPKPIASHRSSATTPQPSHAFPSVVPPPPTNALRLITSEPERYSDYRNVDKARLRRAYDMHRAQFWHAVAGEYGDSISANVLEDVWWRQYSSNLPPTPPNRSPLCEKASHNRLAPAPALMEIPPTATFNPVNVPSMRPSPPPSNPPSRSNTFKIESLLTEDKEIHSSPATVMAH